MSAELKILEILNSNSLRSYEFKICNDFNYAHTFKGRLLLYKARFNNFSISWKKKLPVDLKIIIDHVKAGFEVAEELTPLESKLLAKYRRLEIFNLYIEHFGNSSIGAKQLQKKMEIEGFKEIEIVLDQKVAEIKRSSFKAI